MKKLSLVLALCCTLVFVSCTKKEEAASEDGEGTTSAATESAAQNPSDEMEQKKDANPDAAPAAAPEQTEEKK